MVKNTNYLSLPIILGIIFYSLNLQAMTQEEDRLVTPIIKQKLENKCVFDYWVLDQITTAVLPDVVFPKELINNITHNIVILIKDLPNYIIHKEGLETLFKSVAVRVLNKNFEETNQFLSRYKDDQFSGTCKYDQFSGRYKDHIFTTREEARKNFVNFYLHLVKNPQRSLEEQSIDLIDVVGNTHTYEFSILPEKKDTLIFSITFVSKHFPMQKIRYALACSKNLETTKVGLHPVDFYPNRDTYMAIPHTEESDWNWMWTWMALRTPDYRVYERRMGYERASNEIKEEMLEETRKFRARLEL